MYGLSGGAGALWFRNWTHALHIGHGQLKLDAFEVCETLKELRGNSLRHTLKGVLAGSACAMVLVYASVFAGYLFAGPLIGNRMQLTSRKQLEGRREYERQVELQERAKRTDLGRSAGANSFMGSSGGS